MSFLGNIGNDGFAVTASDTIPLTKNAGALYIGGAGDVAIKTLSGTTLTFAGVQAGSILPMGATFVMSTNTTATSIIAITATQVR